MDDVPGSELPFREALESLGEGIFVCDPEGRLRHANPRFSEITGWSLEEARGRPAARLFVPEEEAPELEARLGLRQPQVPVRQEVHLTRRDGSRIWTEVEVDPLRKPDGTVEGAVGAIMDVTERKETEEALRLSQERFRRLVEHAPEAIVVVDADSQEILLVNENCVRLFGRPRDELMEVYPPDLSPPRQPDGSFSREKAQEYIERALAGENLTFEWVHLRADGSEVLCEVRLSALPMDGRAVVRGSLTDIGERKRAEEALRESEERYRALFEDDVAGNYVVSADGVILNCNEAFARIFGFASREDAVGTQVVPLLEEAETRQRFLQRLRTEGQLKFHETEASRLDGSRVHVVENVRGVFDENGELLEVRGHMVDLTDRKMLEEQLRQAQKMEAVGQLAGGIAHDFNNLLTAVTGHAELLLLDEETPDPVRDGLGKIKVAAERATTLTRQLLAFSRRQVLQPKVLDLNEVVREVHDILHRVLGEDVSLTLDLGELDPVKTDPNQVEQTLLNLAVNARDAMPRGGTITIGTRTVELGPEAAVLTVDAAPGSYVLMEVSDTGHGMPPEVKEKIFEPFFTTKEPGKGTGLGLAQVYGFVRQTGGFLEVESEPEEGTTFKIYVPRHDPRTEPPGPGDRDDGSGGPPTILLVEDEEGVLDLGREILEGAGYRVLVADGPRQALFHAERWPGALDLLLTDVVMPGMSGPELAGRIRSVRPTIGILYMSGHANPDLGGGPEEVEPDDVLAKPFSPGRLLDRVGEVLGGRVGRASARAGSAGRDPSGG